MAIRPTPKGEASRKSIVDAAYRLFLERGYHATSARDIAAAAGLTTGGVYTHFADKEQIFTAVLDAYHPFWQILPALSAAEGDTVDGLVHDMARRMVEALGTQREALNLVFIEIVEFQGRHFGEMFPQYFPALAGIIGRVLEARGPKRAIPLPVLVRTFFGLFISFFLTNIALAGQLTFDEKTLDQFVDVYLYGILAAGEPASLAPAVASAGEDTHLPRPADRTAGVDASLPPADRAAGEDTDPAHPADRTVSEPASRSPADGTASEDTNLPRSAQPPEGPMTL